MEAYTEEQLDQIFYALSDRNRRLMIRMLSGSAMNIKDLLAHFDMTKQAVSKHVKVLEAAGLIEKQKDGRLIKCELQPGPLNACQQVLQQYQQFWNRQLDALDEYLKGKEPR